MNRQEPFDPSAYVRDASPRLPSTSDDMEYLYACTGKGVVRHGAAPVPGHFLFVGQAVSHLPEHPRAHRKCHLQPHCLAVSCLRLLQYRI